MSKRKLDFSIGVPLLRLLSPFASSGAALPPLKKILVIKLAAVGDTVLLVPVLGAFRAAHPQATIHWLASSINAAIAGTVPYVDRVVEWPGSSPSRLLAFVRALRREGYDAVIDAEQWARGSALLSFASGAPVRAGFDTPGQFRAALFTHRPRKRDDRHELEEFYDLFSVFGPIRRDGPLELFETAEGRAQADRLVDTAAKSPRPVMLLHPGCGADGAPREWPITSYAALGRWLIDEFDTRLILTSGPEETWKTARLHEFLQGAAVDAGGKLSWAGIVSLVARVDALVSGNTGIMHIAAAWRKKQVALHGPTDPRLWGPVNDRAIVIQSPCPQCPCLKLGFEYHRKTQECMAMIPLEAVQNAIRSLFGAPGGKA